MSELMVKETAEDSSEMETIKQAKQGDATAFERLYKKHCGRRLQRVFAHDQESNGSGRSNAANLFTGVSQDWHVPRRVRPFNLGAQGNRECRADAHTSKKAHEIIVEDLDRHIANGELPVNLVQRINRCWGGRSDQSVARAAQVTHRLQKTFSVARRDRL